MEKTVKQILKGTFLYSFWVVLTYDPSESPKVNRVKISNMKSNKFMNNTFVMKGISV